MKYLFTLPPLLVLAACLLPTASSADKPAAVSDRFFAEPKVLQLSLDIAAKEVDALRREPRKYAKATLKEGDKNVYKEIGVHLKGAAGSYRDLNDKPGLTLNMDKFEGNELFFGMDKFHLSNSLQDPSYVSELLCGEIYRAAGVPASRVAFAIVTINGRRRGLYYLKEGYDKFFLQRHFKNKDGNFYDGGFLRDIDQPLQLLSGRDDVKNHADLKALTAATRERDLNKRFEKLDKLLDMNSFISYLVLQVLTWDWDGYPMNRNNYRIYHHPKTDKITFIPSGMDQMFGDPGGTIFPHFQGFVARALLETPEGRKRYVQRMREILQKVFVSDDLCNRLDALQKIVQPALSSVDAGAGRDYPNQIQRLKNGIRHRFKSAEEQLKREKK